MTPRQLLLELQSRLIEEYDAETELLRVSAEKDVAAGEFVWTPKLVLKAVAPTSPYTTFEFSINVPESQYIFDCLVVDTIEGPGTSKQLVALNDGTLERISAAVIPELIGLYVREIRKQYKRSSDKSAELMKGSAIRGSTDTLTINFEAGVYKAEVR